VKRQEYESDSEKVSEKVRAKPTKKYVKKQESSSEEKLAQLKDIKSEKKTPKRQE
jgi:hypothetical protein